MGRDHACVLPADAEVFRPRPRPATRTGRPPRRRGDVPLPVDETTSLPESSPPTRECSDGDVGDVLLAEVLPADAGVFRFSGSWVTPTRGPPRRRGGVPKPAARRLGPVSFFPPTRGCSAAVAVEAESVPVLPADAGVFRRGGRPRTIRAGSPRRRGGVPIPPSAKRCVMPSSPPTRGCSAARQGDGTARAVLPADAGVFRGPPGRRHRTGRPPRRRGGVPPGVFLHDCGDMSSPPTRGCSAALTWRPTPMPVLPADAGVFRGPDGSPVPADRPPRRRGGVPMGGFGNYAVSLSSPPTRGCSAVQALADTDLEVLPADAGVFPAAGRSRGPGRRPPRRRGGVPARCGEPS